MNTIKGGFVMSKVTILSFLFFLTISTVYSNFSKSIIHKDISIKKEHGYAVFTNTPLYGEPGEPVLPVSTYTFLVSPGADLKSIKASISGLAQKTLASEFTVKPGEPLSFQNRVIWPEGKKIIDGKDVEIYSKNAFFPKSHVNIATAGMMRQYKIIQVEVWPFLYNPVTKKLKKMIAGNLQIEYSDKLKGHANKSPQYKAPLGTTKMVKKLVKNYSDMVDAYAAYNSNQKGGLAIITTNAIQSGSQQLAEFIKHKESRGYTVTLETKNSWRTSEIRNWIKTNYQSLAIEHLLLIGDPTPSSNADVPMYKSGKTPTDWYYAELSGSNISSRDVFAEVHVGRIPVYNSGDIQKLDKILVKTMEYENKPAEEIGWRFKVLLSMKPIDKRTQAYELGEQIKDHTLVPCNWEYYRVYAKNYSLNPPPELTPVTSSNTQRAWKNEKPGCVFWDTHGLATSSSGMIKVSEINQLDDSHPVFTFQGACLNAKPDVKNNLCYSLLQHGAIATNGGTISVSYTSGESDYTNTGSIGGQNYWYAQALIRDSLSTAASNDYARVKIKGKKWANHCALVLYGDPTVSPYSCEINTAPYIAISSPNGGEKVEQRSVCEITWRDNIPGNVKIELFKGGSIKKTITSSTESNGSFTWNVAADQELGNDYKVKITSLDSANLFQESQNEFSIVPEYILVCPYFQNFDTLKSGSEILPFKYEQLTTDDHNWTVLSGPTPSRVDDPPDVTGPRADNTTGQSGNYIYTEASASASGNPNKKFDFITPKFNFNALNKPLLTFYYHMLSNNAGEDHMGELHLDICVDGTWKTDIMPVIKGNQGDAWHDQQVDLSAYKGERVVLRFRGITGDSWESDIALDDIKIAEYPTNILNANNLQATVDLHYHNSFIHFTIPKINARKKIALTLYNLQGKKIKTLINKRVKAGYHAIAIDHVLASGMYHIVLTCDKFAKRITISHMK